MLIVFHEGSGAWMPADECILMYVEDKNVWDEKTRTNDSISLVDWTNEPNWVQFITVMLPDCQIDCDDSGYITIYTNIKAT